jgi:ribosome-associated toxin RatA of RatAB toxin-antitoxin module
MRSLFVGVMLFATVAQADELSSFLSTGPAVRIETDANGKLKQSTCLADVNANVDTVWKVLTDFEQYRFFMPRIDKMKVTPEGNDFLLELKIDTPLVATSYTNKATPDLATRTIKVQQVKGDLSGSRYLWKLTPIGDSRTRISYTGIIKNFSSVAEAMEDDQQTLTIGINVVSLMAQVKAVKSRAEQMQKAMPAAAPAVATAPPTTAGE